MLFLVEMFSWILPILAVLVLLIVIAAGYVKAPPDQAGSCVIGGGIIVTDGTVNAGGIQKAIDQHHRKVFRCFYNIGIILFFHLDKF